MYCSFCEKDLKDHEDSTKSFILNTLSLIKKKTDEKKELISKGKAIMHDDFKFEQLLNEVANKDPFFIVSFDPSKEFVSLNCLTEFLENEDVNFSIHVGGSGSNRSKDIKIKIIV